MHVYAFLVMQITVKNVNRFSGSLSVKNLLLLLVCVSVFVAIFASDEKNTFQGQKLSWKDDDDLEIKIIRPISNDKCKIKSQAGDIVEQYYKLTDSSGNEIGSNFGKTP